MARQICGDVQHSCSMFFYLKSSDSSLPLKTSHWFPAKETCVVRNWGGYLWGVHILGIYGGKQTTTNGLSWYVQRFSKGQKKNLKQWTLVKTLFTSIGKTEEPLWLSGTETWTWFCRLRMFHLLLRDLLIWVDRNVKSLSLLLVYSVASSFIHPLEPALSCPQCLLKRILQAFFPNVHSLSSIVGLNWPTLAQPLVIFSVGTQWKHLGRGILASKAHCFGCSPLDHLQFILSSLSVCPLTESILTFLHQM